MTTLYLLYYIRPLLLYLDDRCPYMCFRSLVRPYTSHCLTAGSFGWNTNPPPTFYFLHMDILSSIRYNLVESPLRTRWIVATVVILIRSDILRALLIAVLYVLVRHRVHPISQNPHVALRR